MTGVQTCALPISIYVRTSSGAPGGNRELQSRGALPWPQLNTTDELKRALITSGPNTEAFKVDSQMPLFVVEKH